MERRPRKQIQYFSDADKSLTDFSASESEYEEESDSGRLLFFNTHLLPFSIVMLKFSPC